MIEMSSNLLDKSPGSILLRLVRADFYLRLSGRQDYPDATESRYSLDNYSVLPFGEFFNSTTSSFSCRSSSPKLVSQMPVQVIDPTMGGLPGSSQLSDRHQSHFLRYSGISL